MKRTALRPATKPMARRSRLPAKNLDRQARLRAEQFGPEAEWMRDLPCCTCGAKPPSEPAHVRSRGAGGKRSDMAPLCRSCHGDQHRFGTETFSAALKRIAPDAPTLAELADRYAAKWAALPAVDRAMCIQLFRNRWPAAARILDGNGGWR